MRERIDKLLSFLPSHYVKDQAAADELFAVAMHYGIRVSRGCKDCIARCYKALTRIQKNNYNMDNGHEYLFREGLHSYRMPNTAKALTNSNSTVEERKAVFDSNEARKSLFDPATIPAKEEKKVVTKKATTEKKATTKKRVSTKKD